MIDIPDSIFPKDKDGNLLCPRCQKQIQACSCPSYNKPVKKDAKFSVQPIVRIDRSGRKGKTVTVIIRLPRNERYLRDLAKTLKMKTGSGGTSYFSEEGGVIEIQGDHKSAIEQFLSEQR